MAINIENMLKLKAFILHEGEYKDEHLEFEMSKWHCGTAACLAGSAVVCLCSVEARRHISSIGGGISDGRWVSETAQKLLGLEDRPRHKSWRTGAEEDVMPDIFGADLTGWPAHIKAEYNAAKSARGRAVAAGKLIDHLVCEEISRLKAEEVAAEAANVKEKKEDE